MLHYVTMNGTPEGRASYFFQTESKADDICNTKNAQAENMGLKVRYSVAMHDGTDVDPKEIRA